VRDEPRRRRGGFEALYENHEQFATQWRRAAGRAVKAGFLLRPDARNLKRAARLSDIGK
jgi:hypothetical protein